MKRSRLSLLLLMAFVLIFSLVGTGCPKKPTPPPPPPPPAATPNAPTARLSVSPSTIERGQAATLTWQTAYATEVTIEPGIGRVNAEGSQTISPTQSTTYVLTARGEGGSATDSARITVTLPPTPEPRPTPRTPTWEELWSTSVGDIYYDYDKSDIRPDAQATLQKNAEFLRQYPQARFVIEGHCDERGSVEYNLGLGDRRAQAAKNALVALGVAADRVSTISYGKERPQCSESNETCWQKNRRAHFAPQK